MTPATLALLEGFRFESPERLAWLWGVAALLGLGAWAISRRRAAAARFVEAGLMAAMSARASLGRLALKLGAAALALSLCVVAAARPQWDPEPSEVRRSGRDVCFVVDVSRSMLAEDLAPNRLERSKLWVGDVVDILEGDRVALVAFAGTSVVRCPPTHDYGFFRLSLGELTTESVGRGGTMIGDALRLARTEVFELGPAMPDGEDGVPGATRFRDVVLITDGEDQGSLPVEAARALAAHGVRLIVIGIGDPRGARIPIRDESGAVEFVRDASGEAVVSRLDSETLREMALATPGGVFLEVGDGTIELDDVYRRLVQRAERNDEEAGEVLKYTEGFQWFLLAALALLLVENLVGERRRAAP